MRLLRDLWATSAPRTGAVGLLMLFWAAGQAGAAALTGSVLVDRSRSAFVLLAVAVVVAVLSDLVLALVAARLTADWSADLRRRLCRRALGQDIPTLEKTPVGELLDRIDGDVYQVASEFRQSGVRIGQSTCAAVLSTLTAFLVWWPAGVVMAVRGAVLVVRLSGPLQRIAPAREREEEAWSDVAAVMEEAIHGQDDVRTSLGQAYVLRLYARRASELMRRGAVVWTASAKVSAIAAGAVRGGIALLVAGGAWALATGRVDGAQLTAVWLLALAYGATVEMISRMVSELQYGLGAWQRVQLLMAASQEPEGGGPVPDADLVVRGLTFTYADAVDEGEGTRPALRDVQLTFRRGRSYAVIGRTGSGKSSLAKVLTRAVELPRGTVFLGDADLLDLDLESLRRWIAVIPQRTEILAGTVAENVALFDPELLPRAADALEELGLAAWVAELPDGIETRLGDGGHKLSAGQEQLVAFARILVRDPHVVILDEATARMDPVTEGAVQRATERLLRDRIGIVIAHRLSSVSRCDEVVVLSEGAVVEAGPLRDSAQFARLLAHSRLGAVADAGDDDEELLGGADGSEVLEAVLTPEEALTAENAVELPRTEPPPLPEPPRARTMREVFRLVRNDPRYGLAAVGLFMVLSILGLDGSVLPWLWAQLVDGSGSVLWPAVGIVAALLVTIPIPYYTSAWFPKWWVMQMMRISLRLVHGQTGPRRVSGHTPAEVVAQGGDTERVVMMADNVVDQFTSVVLVVAMTLVSGSIVPALFFVGTMAASGAAATLFGPVLKAAAQRTVAARAAFATALVSSLSAARTVKLAGASRPVLAHLAGLDALRSELQRREISLQVWARSTPSLVSGLLPIGAWALYLGGRLSSASVLIIVSTLGAARWFAWTTASLIAQLPSARVWTRRTVAMAGVEAYSAPVPGVDLWQGTAPAPPVAPRTPLRRLGLVGFGAVHEDGTLGAHDVDLTVRRGQLVLVVGPVGAGKSSLLRALAGIVHHTGELRWNGEPIETPEVFLRPNQVGYVAQLPRVLSGTVAENIRLGHEVDAGIAVSTAQLEHDLDVLTASPDAELAPSPAAAPGGAATATAARPRTAADGGLGLLIGHKGTRLSGGQLQRLALARALAPQTELLVADDISSALDVVTELELWQALRDRGITVIGSTSKRAALALADQVVVLVGGRVLAHGTWRELEDRWSHLAG
ncbi:MAG TPA: ABC transporter ATP-binding protein [Kineosporiaceae bacterium]|nr:ABC transporter ATP-binding protein [Kineosporiaceae bacterium]